MTDQSWGESPWSELGDVPPVGVPPVGVRSGSTRLLLQGRGHGDRAPCHSAPRRGSRSGLSDSPNSASRHLPGMAGHEVTTR